MKTRHFIFPVLLGLGAPAVFAEDPAPPVLNPSAPKAATPEAAATAPAEKPMRPRAVSDEVSATILAGMPKFNPPPKKPEPKSDEELPDMREVDKPKNGIIRLPKYTVQEKRPAVLQERDVYTKQGLAALARRRYITDADMALNHFAIPLFSPISTAGSGSATTDRAMAMYADDERLKNMADLNDTARDVAKSDPAAGRYIKRVTQETYMRSDDFGWSSPRTEASR